MKKLLLSLLLVPAVSMHAMDNDPDLAPVTQSLENSVKAATEQKIEFLEYLFNGTDVLELEGDECLRVEWLLENQDSLEFNKAWNELMQFKRVKEEYNKYTQEEAPLTNTPQQENIFKRLGKRMSGWWMSLSEQDLKTRQAQAEAFDQVMNTGKHQNATVIKYQDIVNQEDDERLILTDAPDLESSLPYLEHVFNASEVREKKKESDLNIKVINASPLIHTVPDEQDTNNNVTNNNSTNRWFAATSLTAISGVLMYLIYDHVKDKPSIQSFIKKTKEKMAALKATIAYYAWNKWKTAKKAESAAA